MPTFGLPAFQSMVNGVAASGAGTTAVEKDRVDSAQEVDSLQVGCHLTSV